MQSVTEFLPPSLVVAGAEEENEEEKEEEEEEEEKEEEEEENGDGVRVHSPTGALAVGGALPGSIFSHLSRPPRWVRAMFFELEPLATTFPSPSAFSEAYAKALDWLPVDMRSYVTSRDSCPSSTVLAMYELMQTDRLSCRYKMYGASPFPHSATTSS